MARILVFRRQAQGLGEARRRRCQAQVVVVVGPTRFPFQAGRDEVRWVLPFYWRVETDRIEKSSRY